MTAEKTKTTTKTFILIPGAWMGAWVWESVTQGLQALGHQVYPVTLSGLGEDADTVDVELETHVNDVRSLLEEHDLQEVILVGHSYSGLVAGQVADHVAGQVPERVAHIIYVDAFLPYDGKSLLEAFGEPQRSDERRQIAENGGRWAAPDVEGAADGHDLSDEQAQELVARLVDHPGRTVTEPAVMKRLLAEQRATYIVCAFGDSEDVAALRKEPNWTFHSLEVGHWPMIAAPEALVALFDDVVL